MSRRLQAGVQTGIAGESAWRGLRDGEQCLASLPALDNGHWLMWTLLALGIGHGLLGVLLVLAWLLPANSGLPWSDRILKLVMLADQAVFGERALHITAERLIVTQDAKPTWEISLDRIALLDARTAWTRGNLVIQSAGAPVRKTVVWVVDRDHVAARIQAACLDRGVS